MDFERDQIYHVYNRGNKSQTLFFSNEHYVSFLSKMEEYIKPYASVLAWCLMPNHFHLMLHVETDQIAWDQPAKGSRKKGRALSPEPKFISLNNSIAVLLRNHTRDVNQEDQRSGPLFHQHTKALCLSAPEFDSDYFRNHFGIMGNETLHESDYPAVCFQYIHFNPVTAKEVENPEDWEFSSYRDYFFEREGTLVNKELARDLGLINGWEARFLIAQELK